MTSLFLIGALIGFAVILLWLAKGFKIVFTNERPRENFLRIR